MKLSFSILAALFGASLVQAFCATTAAPPQSSSAPAARDGRTATTAPARRPNIILIMTDDQGYGDLACHGNPIVQTPNIDRLHRESVRFTNFHVSPTCAPTRSALLTGRHEFRNGVTHTILERERMTLAATTLAELLRDAGYATGIFGKWHLGDEPPYQPDRRGFAEVFIHGGGGIGQTYPGSCGDAPGNKYFDPALLHNGTFVKTRGYCTDVFFAHAIEWMDEQLDAGMPFFCYLTPNAPHEPLEVPDEYARLYAGKVPDNVAKFYGMITNIDDNVGRLLAKLEEWGIAEKTLLIFMTDNGSAHGWKIYNAGRRGGKGTPFEGATRVPAFWRWPAAWRGGIEVTALTAHIDVVPTLAEIAGISLSAKMRAQIEGRSLLPLLRDPSATWPDRFLFTHVGRWERGKAKESKFAKCAVRNARFALVNNTELYDLETDPAQKTNIIAENPPVLEALRAAYDQWWNEILPALCNEDARGPALNPFKERYWKQFGGAP
jgi:arylsulfatase